MTRTSAVGLGVSRDKNRRGKQYRCRLFHHRGLLDLGRFETEDEAKLAYDQAVRALKLEKSLNYPATSPSQYFSPDVAKKVQAFMAKNTMEPSNSCSSTPGGDDQHTDLNESPTTSGNSTASGGLGDCGSAQGQHHHLHSYPDEYMYMHPDHEYMHHHVDMHAMDQAAVEALAAAAAGGAHDMCGHHHQHMECMPDMMQLGQQHMGGGYCDDGSGCGTDMLLPGQQQGYAACTWEEAAMQMQLGPPAGSFEAQQQGMMAGCCDMPQQLACGGGHYMEEAPAMQELEQQQHTDMYPQQLQTEQQQQGQQGQGKAPDDVRVMLALLAEILAEDEMHGPADLLDNCHAGDVSHAQLQEQQEEAFLQEQEAFLPTHQEEQEHQGYQMHQEQPQGCGTGYLAAPACAYLQAGPAGSPSTPVLQDSSSDTLGYHDAASVPQQQQPTPQQQQLNCHVKQQQQQWMPAANANGGGRTAPEPQQAQLPCLVSYGEVVLFVDVTTKLMLQLYTQLTANSMQHAGLTAIQWMANVRMNLGVPAPNTPGNSPSLSAGEGSVGGAGAPGLPAAVHAAVLHTCTSLVSVGAGSGPDMVASLSGGGSFSSCFLVTVLEQVMKALMSLRSMCSMCCPTQALCPSVVTAMQGQLQAQSDTHEGQAVVTLLGWLLGYGC